MAGSGGSLRQQVVELQDELAMRKEDAKHLQALLQKSRAQEAQATKLAEEREKKVLQLKDKVEKFRRRDVDRAAFLEETRSRHLQEVTMLENIIKDLHEKLESEGQTRRIFEKRCSKLESRLFVAKAPAEGTVEKLGKARHCIEKLVESLAENQTAMQQQLDRINLTHVAFCSNIALERLSSEFVARGTIGRTIAKDKGVAAKQKN